MNNSKITETIAFLAKYNSWRRGNESEMPSPAEIGAAIDDAVNLLRRQAELERQLNASVAQIEANWAENDKLRTILQMWLQWRDGPEGPDTLFADGTKALKATREALDQW